MARTIYFTKSFTGGVLKGLTYEDRITVPNSLYEKYMEGYRESVASKRVYRGTGSPYVIISVTGDEDGKV